MIRIIADHDWRRWCWGIYTPEHRLWTGIYLGPLAWYIWWPAGVAEWDRWEQGMQ